MTTRRFPLDEKISDTFQYRDNQTGDIGLEIEAEGVGIPLELGAPWTVVEDHSLRAPPGGAAREYRYRKSVPIAGVPKSLDIITEGFKNAKPRWSYRTSVHTHVNVRNMTLRQLYNMMVAYIIMEIPLAEFAGGLRRCGNLFCLRAVDAEAIVDNLMLALKQDAIRDYFLDDGQHYAGMNISAVPQRGSLEFRAMQGNLDKRFIQSWVDTLIGLREKAIGFADPRAVCENLSKLGINGFLRAMLPEVVYGTIRHSDTIEDDIRTGVRLAQEIAYAIEWPVEPDKFPKKKDWDAPMPNNRVLDVDLGVIMNAQLRQPRPRADRGQRQAAAPEALQPVAERVVPAQPPRRDFGDIIANPVMVPPGVGDHGIINGQPVEWDGFGWVWRHG